jgi:protein-S-isoprenylcysteine O-methyltransferase Ste14
MKTGTGLALIAVGAILAFAVNASSSVINLHVAGYVLMLIGIAGMAIPRRGYGWMGRRIFVRRTERQRGRVAEVTYPPYMVRNPENTPVRAGLTAGHSMAGNSTAVSSDAATDQGIPRREPGETEVIEDIYEE